MQVETNDVTGQVIRGKIKWTGACEYQLLNAERSDSAGLFKPMWAGKVITAKILQAESDYCVYEASMEGVSMKIIDALRVMK